MSDTGICSYWSLNDPVQEQFLNANLTAVNSELVVSGGNATNAGETWNTRSYQRSVRNQDSRAATAKILIINSVLAAVTVILRDPMPILNGPTLEQTES